MPTLGVDYACFGEYHCKTCNRKWASARAWKKYGQKCTTCDEIIQATKLRELFKYYCRACKKLWKSKWEDEGADCKDCGVTVKPFKTHAEFKKFEAEWILPEKLSRENDLGIPIEPEKPHRSDLCEKCQKTGVDCITKRPVPKSSGVARPGPPPPKPQGGDSPGAYPESKLSRAVKSLEVKSPSQSSISTALALINPSPDLAEEDEWLVVKAKGKTERIALRYPPTPTPPPLAANPWNPIRKPAQLSISEFPELPAPEPRHATAAVTLREEEEALGLKPLPPNNSGAPKTALLKLHGGPPQLEKSSGTNPPPSGTKTNLPRAKPQPLHHSPGPSEIILDKKGAAAPLGLNTSPQPKTFLDGVPSLPQSSSFQMKGSLSTPKSDMECDHLNQDFYTCLVCGWQSTNHRKKSIADLNERQRLIGMNTQRSVPKSNGSFTYDVHDYGRERGIYWPQLERAMAEDRGREEANGWSCTFQ